MSERTQQHPAHAADELRARIQAFRLDEPGSVFPFSARLARENGWTRDHALRVIEEYRRFVYLATTAGHTVTPSVAVDEAWHLHLTYTRSYWDELCGKVLGRPLHHDPTRGGGAEGARFLDAYTRTLRSYQEAFGAAPPRDIWPSPAERFAPVRRVRWAIPSPHTVLALLGLLVLVGCTADSGAIPFVLLFVVFAAIVTAQPTRGKKRPTDGGGCGGGDCGDGGGDGCGGGCGGCGG
jgi:hypothetical protein